MPKKKIKLNAAQIKKLSDAQIDMHRIVENGKRINDALPTNILFDAVSEKSPLGKVFKEPVLRNAVTGMMLDVFLSALGGNKISNVEIIKTPNNSPSKS